MEAKAIQTNEYLEMSEIQKHLENVEYIIMATPAPAVFKENPIHFTIFLNTPKQLPDDIKETVLNKFLEENSIIKPIKVMSQLMPVGFALSTQETPMPMLLVKPEDQKSIPHAPMHVIDFLADSDNFYEAKEKSLTGWSYSYN